jgi:hypothetical protein
MHKKWLKTIEKFNTPDTALVVSAWPVEGKNAVNHGIAWYTKMTVMEMAKKQNKKFVVLAETNHDNRPLLLARGRVLVLRVFDNTHKSLYPKILRWLTPFNQVKRVYVHSEFGANGGLIHFAMILPFLTLIRLMRKQIFYYSHNVLADISMLSGHLNIPAWQHGIFNLALKAYYKALRLLTKKIITLDSSLGLRLSRFVGKEHIISLQIPVAAKQSLSKKLARKRLGIGLKARVVTTFGFVSWYKGTDWHIRAPLSLLVAGGPSYSLAAKSHYQKYYAEAQQSAKDKSNIMITGFVPEEKIGLYMAATDLIVLPYRGLMGSSGSWSHALAYGKPFMMSEQMGELLPTNSSLKKALTFSLNTKGAKKIAKITKSRTLLLEYARVARQLAYERRLEKLALREYNELYAQTIAIR